MISPASVSVSQRRLRGCTTPATTGPSRPRLAVDNADLHGKKTVFKFCHVLSSRLDSAGYIGVFTIDSGAHDDRPCRSSSGVDVISTCATPRAAAARPAYSGCRRAYRLAGHRVRPHPRRFVTPFRPRTTFSAPGHPPDMDVKLLEATDDPEDLICRQHATTQRHLRQQPVVRGEMLSSTETRESNPERLRAFVDSVYFGPFLTRRRLSPSKACPAPDGPDHPSPTRLIDGRRCRTSPSTTWTPKTSARGNWS